MNFALSAYKNTIRNTESPRQIERRIMSRMTNRLVESRGSFDNTPSKTERLQILSDGLREALSDNLKLWLAFKSDLLREGNALPVDLRASLVSLANFVESQTAKILAAEGNVAPLVDVNTSILGNVPGQSEGAA